MGGILHFGFSPAARDFPSRGRVACVGQSRCPRERMCDDVFCLSLIASLKFRVICVFSGKQTIEGGRKRKAEAEEAMGSDWRRRRRRDVVIEYRDVIEIEAAELGGAFRLFLQVT